MAGIKIDPAPATALRKMVEEAERIALISHTAPDGDSVGSSIGFAAMLREKGKSNISVIVPDDIPQYLYCIPGANKVIVHETHPSEAEKALAEADLVFCMDFNAPHRVAGLQSALESSSAPKVLIDHHLYPADIFTLSFSYPPLSSTSELVLRLAKAIGMESCLTQDAATALMTGILTDTGVFSYSSSDPDLYLLVADLMRAGADKDTIIRNTFQQNSEGKMRMQGYVLYEKMTLLPEMGVAYFTLSAEELVRFHNRTGDTDGLANLPLDIAGIEAVCFLREDKNQIKLSFRSTGNYPVNTLAENFGGGGHKNAAGGEFQGSLQEATEKLLKIWKDFNPKNYDNKNQQ